MDKSTIKLKWIQSDFMQAIPIYYVHVPGYEDADAICIRIEYLFHEQYWIIDICQTVRIMASYTISQVDEAKKHAEQQLYSYLQSIKKLF